MEAPINSLSPRILFLIKSAPQNYSRRQDQGKSWLLEILDNSAYYFCIGDPNYDRPTLEDNTLWLPFSDDYNHLPFKMKSMVSWAATKQDFDYFVTMDDDVFVDTEKLYRFLSFQPDYFGNRWDGDPSHISGMLVGYSKKTFTILANIIDGIPDVGADDILVSRILYPKLSGLNVMTDSERFKPYGYKASSVTIAAEIRPYREGAMLNYKLPS